MAQPILPAQLEELKPLKQWVCYQAVWDEKKQKYSKIPKNPATGYGAKANDPSTWATYAEAIRAAETRQLTGVGFEFASGYMGIDLDGVINDSGQLSDFAAEIVRTLDSYTEYSPSGTGLHILVKTTLGNVGSRNDDIGLEMYNNGRFFTVTGKVYGQPKPIQERTQQAQAVFDKYLRKPDKAAQQPAHTPVGAYSADSSGDLWRKMFDSRNGAEIRALYSGDISGHADDHSRADQALANHLAYWTNGDPAKIDDMFRQSGLMRPKWDEQRGAQTYGEKTIANALADFRPYTPPARQQPAAAAERGNGDNMSNTENTEQQAQQQPAPGLFDGNSKPDSVKGYLYGTFGADLDHFQSFKDRKTGYSNIDALTSLYPGLYVIGAISSLGKTTFTHQLGDQLAAAGDHVLYFSLEQTRLEMVSKGISRRTAQNSYKDGFSGAVSAIDIRRGSITEAVRQAAKEYAKDAENESVVECSFDTTIDTIVGYVTGYIKANDAKPVVIVDYLQIIRPTDPRQTTKDAVDGHVRALKKLQTENDLVVIVISSLNRQNYLTPVDFESFKESGGIEYTADVIWGLQLAIMNGDLFDKKDKLKEKREKVKAAKLEVPRKIELVCLKNRYGRSSYSCGFNYYPQFDLFVPEDDFIPIDDDDLPFDK